MNGRKAKAIRKKSLVILYAWVKTLVSEEEAAKMKPEDAIRILPIQTHNFIQGQLTTSACSFKWIQNRIKKALKNGKSLDDIGLEDFNA